MSDPKSRASAAFRSMRDSHPELIDSAAGWTERADAYWKKVRTYDTAIIVEACRKTKGRFAAMPTPGELAGLCKVIKLEWKIESEKAVEQSERATSDRRNAEHVADLRKHVIPANEVDQKVWVKDGGTPLERCARAYEVESKRINLDPNKSCPTMIQETRWRQFWDAFNDKTAPTGAEEKT